MSVIEITGFQLIKSVHHITATYYDLELDFSESSKISDLTLNIMDLPENQTNMDASHHTHCSV